MEKYFKEPDISEFVSEYFNKTYVDPAYQRREVWSENFKYRYIKSVYSGFTANPIILVNVSMCLDYAEVMDNKEDIEYFRNLKNSGIKFISVDGNNRSQTINSYLNRDLEKDVNKDSNREVFKKKKIELRIFGDISKEQIHELAITTNMGNPWNEQENRNAMNTTIASFIREITEKLRPTINKVKIIGTHRMKDSELLTKMLTYEIYGKTKLTQKILDKVYRTKDVDISKFQKNITTLMKVMEHHTTSVRLHNSEFFNLYMLISFLKNNNMSINNLKEFYTEFYTKQNLRRLDNNTTYNSENGKIVTWSGLNGNIGLDQDVKLNTILKDIDLDKHITTKDKQRNFSIGQKIKIWENTNGMVRINNNDKPVDGKVYNKENKNDFLKVNLMEVLNGEKWVVDHIHPHTEGGQTTIENGEITSREYNLWKTKKKYDIVIEYIK
jgi:hypothetical protein